MALDARALAERDKRSGAKVALLARQSVEGLSYAVGAFFALKDAQRGALRDRLARLIVDRCPIPALRKRGARWVKPETRRWRPTPPRQRRIAAASFNGLPDRSISYRVVLLHDWSNGITRSIKTDHL